MRTALFLLAACLAITSTFAKPSQEERAWWTFKAKFGKKYETPKEEETRRNLFLQSRDRMDRHNERYLAGLESHTKGINQFSDMTEEEMQSYASCFKIPEGGERGLFSQVELDTEDGSPLPEKVDWREAGAVTPVKDQGMCGSCWAFSTTGTLEGAHFLKTGELVSLSEQNILDCDYVKNVTEGCNGGYPAKALAFIHQEGGIDTEASYPYTAAWGIFVPFCQFDRSTVGATVERVVQVKNDTMALMRAVASKGPISVAITGNAFFEYGSGILHSQLCHDSYREDEVNHAVLLVGYGTEEGQDYWIVKNSWGPQFGENGFIRIARGYGNDCQITGYAYYPVV